MKQHIVENEDCWLYRDYGVDAFQYGNFTVDARIENYSGGPWGIFLMFSNHLHDRKWLVDNDKNYICFIFTTTGIHIQKSVVGVLATDSYAVAEDNKWWSLTLTWNTTAIYGFVYNNTLRTSAYLEDTLTVPALPSTFRYMIATNLRNRTNVANCDLLLKYLDLGLLDTVDPKYVLVGLNSTVANAGIQLTLNLTDNYELDVCFLEWNNTGTLTNISLSISGTKFLCLFNQTLNATETARINYRFFFNDTANNQNQTVQHFLIVTAAPRIWIVSAFNWTTINPDANTSILFNATYSNSSDSITEYSWNFGDGNTTTGNYETITHQYLTNGTYTITLNVTSVAGSSNLQEGITIGGNNTATVTVTVNQSITPDATKIGGRVIIIGGFGIAFFVIALVVWKVH